MFKYFFIAVLSSALCAIPAVAHAADDFIPTELLEKAELDDVAAQANICALYNSAEHSGRNDQEGFKWCTIAGRRGSAESQYHLANMLLEGRGYQKNEALAVQWLTQAAMQEHAEAQFSLAKIYFDGIGVEKDVAKAYEWTLRATRPRGKLPAPKGAHALTTKIEWQLSAEQMRGIQQRVSALPPAQ